MELKGKKINFLGDSITHAGNLGDDTKRFTYLIEQECDAIVRNYGVGGTCIAKSLKPSEVAEWDQDFISRVDGMDSDADIVVVFGGTNDYGHGTVPIGTMDDRTDDTFYGALHTLYTMLLNKYPYAQLVVITPLHRFNENKSQKTQSDMLEEMVKQTLIKEFSPEIQKMKSYNLLVDAVVHNLKKKSLED